MGLANEQRRTEQLWWTRDLIEDLIVEKSPDFLEHHKNIDELIKQYEPEILAVFSDIADLIIKKQTDKLQDEIPTVEKRVGISQVNFSLQSLWKCHKNDKNSKECKKSFTQKANFLTFVKKVLQKKGFPKGL